MKTVSKRRAGNLTVAGAGNGAGLGVLDAPEPEYAPAPRSRRSSSPAAASGLQRPYSGFAGEGYSPDGFDGGDFDAEAAAPRARRGALRPRLRRLPRTLGGRIVLGAGLLLVLGCAAAAVVEVRSFAMHDPRFLVATSADIQVTGAAHLSRDQVLSVFADDIERNIFHLPLAQRQAELEQIPWVAHATVMRLLPDQIRVAVTERIPVAFVRQGTQIGLVDANGVLLNMPVDDAGNPNYSFPVLTGILAADPLSMRAARMEIYRRFIGALDSTGQKFSQTVSEVDVSDPEDVKAMIYSPGAGTAAGASPAAGAGSSVGAASAAGVSSAAGASGGADILVHFGEQHFLQRYQEFEQHLPDWRQQYPRLASADMRYEGQVVLQMQPGQGASAATATAQGTTAAGAVPATPTARVMKVSAAKARPVRGLVRRPYRARVATATARGRSGMSPSNERMFAALAAAHRAAVAKAAAARSAARSQAAYRGGGTTP